jgi:hypothetical protein
MTQIYTDIGTLGKWNLSVLIFKKCELFIYFIPHQFLQFYGMKYDQGHSSAEE